MGLEFTEESVLVIRIDEINDLEDLKAEFAKRNDLKEKKIKTAGL